VKLDVELSMFMCPLRQVFAGLILIFSYQAIIRKSKQTALPTGISCSSVPFYLRLIMALMCLSVEAVSVIEPRRVENIL
jgi:TRAP-type C4-dicarboxylate transport system permease small subunit